MRNKNYSSISIWIEKRIRSSRLRRLIWWSWRQSGYWRRLWWGCRRREWLILKRKVIWRWCVYWRIGVIIICGGRNLFIPWRRIQGLTITLNSWRNWRVKLKTCKPNTSSITKTSSPHPFTFCPPLSKPSKSTEIIFWPKKKDWIFPSNNKFNTHNSCFWTNLSLKPVRKTISRTSCCKSSNTTRRSTVSNNKISKGTWISHILQTMCWILKNSEFFSFFITYCCCFISTCIFFVIIYKI